MCNNNKELDACKCISEILTVINILQQNANCSDACLDTCDRGFLGCSATSLSCNTRPVMLYTCCGNGTPWSMPVTKEDVTCGETGVVCSSVFRIEKIDGCCATFRVLANNPDETCVAKIPYVTTNSFFTMNLNCVCSLRCLPDTYVECI
ncbi:MAG: CotY/CotZ family spore coat protein [Bacilli bacterium]